MLSVVLPSINATICTTDKTFRNQFGIQNLGSTTLFDIQVNE